LLLARRIAPAKGASIVPHLSRRDIEARLWDDMELKRKEYFMDPTSAAGRAAYETALRHFNEFVLNGKIPPEIDQPT
jgi:hypothetical protein